MSGRSYAFEVPQSLARGSSPTGHGRARLDGTLEFAVGAHAHDPDTVLITVEGDVDLHSVSRLEQVLEGASAGSATRVVLDLTEVTLFDSSAIHALLVARSSAVERETKVVIVCANPPIVRVLEVAGITELVPVHSSLTQATDGLTPAA